MSEIDYSNRGFTNLKGCSEIINGGFNCSNNELITLEYSLS